MTDRGLNKLSDGEQRLAIATVATAVYGAILALAVQNRLSDGLGGLPTFDLQTLWVCAAGFIGAGFAFRFCWGNFGWTGLAGASLAVAQGVWLTAVGAIIAGTLVLPIYGTMFAPWLLLMTFVDHPLLLLLWVMMLGASHVLMTRWQAERNSIFVPLKSRSS